MRQPYSQEEKQNFITKFQEARARGLNQNDAAQEAGVPKATVLSWIGPMKPKKNKPEVIAVPPATKVESFKAKKAAVQEKMAVIICTPESLKDALGALWN